MDQIREKLIQVEPEETVRQKFISYLINKLKVPKEMIRVEESLTHYGLDSLDRADIVVNFYDENDFTYYPLLVIETKKPDEPITTVTFEQLYKYCDRLGAAYGLISNGTISYAYYFDIDKVYDIEELPSYNKMLDGEYKEQKYEKYKMIKYENLDEFVLGYGSLFISSSMNKELQIFVANMYQCFMDDKHFLKEQNYGLFTLVKDLGMTYRSYGNHNSQYGKYEGYYRTFIVRRNGNDELVSISFQLYSNEETILCVGHETKDKVHHSLQLNLNKYVYVDGHRLRFYHNGTLALGHSGSIKRNDVLRYVKKVCPSLIPFGDIELGTIYNDHNFKITEKEVRYFIVKLIAYSLLRDEVRTRKEIELGLNNKEKIKYNVDDKIVLVKDFDEFYKGTKGIILYKETESRYVVDLYDKNGVSCGAYEITKSFFKKDK